MSYQVLYMDSSETSGLPYGTKAFRVVVHDHDKPPSIERNGILFEPGKSTTIRVRRYRTNLVNTREAPCHDSAGYTKVCFNHYQGQNILHQFGQLERSSLTMIIPVTQIFRTNLIMNDEASSNIDVGYTMESQPQTDTGDMEKLYLFS